jgi:hypothetical protein
MTQSRLDPSFLGISPVYVHYDWLSLMFGVALVTLWLVLSGYALKDIPGRTLIGVTGYLRRRPDPYLEDLLRGAFRRFDHDVTGMLGDCPDEPTSPDGASPGLG